MHENKELLKRLISIPKVDAHNHLNLGMRYSAWSKWSGVVIPDFPRKLNGFQEMDEIILDYTRPACRTMRDVETLISMSIREAINDGVALLEGSIDIGFVEHCKSIEKFLVMVERVTKRFASRIEFRPELGMGKTFGTQKILQWAPACLESGLFKSIDLYGPEVDEVMEDFRGVYSLAGKLGIKKKAHAGEFSGPAAVRRFVEYLDLDEVQHGIGAAEDDSVLCLLKDRNVRCNVCPASNVALGAVESLEKHPVKRFLQVGVRVSIGPDDLLFFNRAISGQCLDLIEAGVLTQEEAERAIQGDAAPGLPKKAR